MWGEIAGSLLGGGIQAIAGRQSDIAAEQRRAKDEAMQREFAQNGIRWRVEDAKAAGLHPLAALGASTPSYSPSSVVGDSMWQGISSMGQDVGRAISATRTKDEKYEKMRDLQIEGASLDNAIRAKQLTNLGGPSFPSHDTPLMMDGQGDSAPVSGGPGVEKLPHGKEPGSQPSYTYMRTSTGLTLAPSESSAMREQQGFIPQLEWAIRNKLATVPGHGKSHPAPDVNKFRLPKGMRWVYVPWAMEWRPVREGSGMDNAHWSRSEVSK